MIHSTGNSSMNNNNLGDKDDEGSFVWMAPVAVALIMTTFLLGSYLHFRKTVLLKRRQKRNELMEYFMEFKVDCHRSRIAVPTLTSLCAQMDHTCLENGWVANPLVTSSNTHLLYDTYVVDENFSDEELGFIINASLDKECSPRGSSNALHDTENIACLCAHHSPEHRPNDGSSHTNNLSVDLTNNNIYQTVGHIGANECDVTISLVNEKGRRTSVDLPLVLGSPEYEEDFCPYNITHRQITVNPEPFQIRNQGHQIPIRQATYDSVMDNDDEEAFQSYNRGHRRVSLSELDDEYQVKSMMVAPRNRGNFFKPSSKRPKSLTVNTGHGGSKISFRRTLSPLIELRNLYKREDAERKSPS